MHEYFLTDLAVIVVTKAKLFNLEKSFLHQQAPGRFECKSLIFLVSQFGHYFKWFENFSYVDWNLLYQD